MAKNPPSKNSKKGGGKAGAKARVVKPATRAKASPQLNRLRLREDVNYYQEQKHINTNRRSKKSTRFPSGVPLKNLILDDDGNYYSADRSIMMTPEEYHRASYNTKSIPLYTPIHGVRKGRKRIIGYRNAITHQEVSEYYIRHYHRPYFYPPESEDLSEEELERRDIYGKAVEEQRYGQLSRKYDLVSSFSIIHPEYVRQLKNGDTRIMVNAILRDPEFQSLVLELETLHTSAWGITKQNIALADLAMGSDYDERRIQMEQEYLKQELAKNPRYAEVLVLLGRRTPKDTQPPGTSDPNHIKLHVIPYYEAKAALTNAPEFEE